MIHFRFLDSLVFLLIVVLVFLRTSFGACKDNVVSGSVILRSTDYQFVYDAFIRNNYTMESFVTNDTTYVQVHYELQDHIMWSRKSICRDDTYLLLLFFVFRGDKERRDIIRQYLKQGVEADGMTVNYVFVVSADSWETDVLSSLELENSIFNDILVSIHRDSYANFTITVLDSFLWVRDHCKEAQYICRIDGDAWLHVGNLVHFLKGSPKRGFFAGRTYKKLIDRRMHYKGFHYIPNDYPEREWIYVHGAANLYSKDVIPFINIGAQFLDLVIPVGDDVEITEILRRAGIKPYSGGWKGYNYLMGVGGKSIKGLTVPNNILFVHGLKHLTLLKEFYQAYSRNTTQAVVLD